MNTVDLIVGLVVILNGLIGAFRGFVWQSIRLGSLILGIFLARQWGADLAAWTGTFLPWDATGRSVLAYCVIFVATYLVVSLLGNAFRKLIDKARLNSTDRSLGFLLGCAKGLVFVWIAFYFLLIFFTFLPDYAQTQLKGDEKAGVAPSKSFQMWDHWVRAHLDKVMPEDIRMDHRSALKHYTTR